MPSFLDSLLELVQKSPIGQGVRSSMDAFEQDLEDVSNLRMPRQAIKVGGQAISAYGNPATGVFLPKIPKYAGLLDDFLKAHPEDKVLWDALKNQPAFKNIDKEVVPTGKFDTIVGTMLGGRGFGQIGEKVNSLRNFLTEMAEQSAGKSDDIANLFKASK